jgi:hypothetical protein
VVATIAMVVDDVCIMRVRAVAVAGEQVNGGDRRYSAIC